jgi:hypothetical protein
MLNVLAKLSHEAEQQGTDSIDAGTQWGLTVLAGNFALYLNFVTESVVAPND